MTINITGAICKVYAAYLDESIGCDFKGAPILRRNTYPFIGQDSIGLIDFAAGYQRAEISRDAEIAALKAEIKLDSAAWAELHTLRVSVQGPDGFATWRDAAVDERVRRVKAEHEIAALKAALQAVLDAEDEAHEARAAQDFSTIKSDYDQVIRLCRAAMQAQT